MRIAQGSDASLVPTYLVTTVSMDDLMCAGARPHLLWWLLGTGRELAWRRAVLLGLLLVLLSGCTRSDGFATRTAQPVMAEPPLRQPTDVAASQHVIACPDATGPISAAIVVGGDGTLLAVSDDGLTETRVLALSSSMWAEQPAWSADGTVLAYTLNQQNPDVDRSYLPLSSICGIERTTGKGRLLARPIDATQVISGASWTPDGQALYVTILHHRFDAASQFLGTEMSVGRYDLSQQALRPLLPDHFEPEIAPDGKTLASIVLDPTTFDPRIVLTSPDGEHARSIENLTEPLATIDSLAWSPDGRRLVFAASFGGAESGQEKHEGQAMIDSLLGVSVAQAHGIPANLWIVNADGTDLRRLTSHGYDDPHAAWSPDGSKLAILTNNAGLVIRDLDNATELAVSSQSGLGGVSWAWH